jgi:UDP-N-acetylglucosamine--N-acetylmuramyl-(pentapeptide) pyrophosphoryl-undecaprenol N-acetylglucosamine transferase
VPMVVHEANVRPGLANRIGARMTDWIATGSPDCRLGAGRYLGMPLRQMISTLDRPARRAEALEFFGFEDRENGPATLLVFGGSQGAGRLNEAIEGAAETFSAAGVQILHATGRGNWREGAQFPVSGAAYVRRPYIDRMDLAYSAADAVLCRGGMMTCSELAAVGLPAVYVPLPIGTGVQRLNAQQVVRAGGGLLVEDEELTSAWLTEHLLPLLADRETLDEMGRAAAAFGRRDGDEALVEMVYEAVGAARGASSATEGAAGRAFGPADKTGGPARKIVGEATGAEL